MLKNFHAIPDIIEGALYHHERFDGKGYPTGKAGKDIPEIGRIICIADSYDAMTTKRCYREPLSEEQVEHELINGRGTQFDPDILDVFMKLVKKKTVDSDSEK
jgi:putative two-component system response regulator